MVKLFGFDKDDKLETRKMEKQKIMKYKDYLKEQKDKWNRKWDFSLFKIVCKKCGSSKVEFNSDMEHDSGYYGDSIIEGGIIIKCHSCGNAIKIDHSNIFN